MAGQPQDAADTVQPTIAALQLITNRSLHADLSPPVVAIAHAIDQGAGLAMGLGKSISGAGLGALSTVAGDAVGAVSDVLANAASLVPLIGAVVKFAAGMVIADLQTRSEGAQAAACQQVNSAFAAKPTGGLFAGGGITPADLFAPVIKLFVKGHPHGWNYDPGQDPTAYLPKRFLDMRDQQDLILTGLGGPTMARSISGLVFMQITEGAVVDELDNWNWPMLAQNLAKANPAAMPNGDAARKAWLAAVQRDLSIASKQWAKHCLRFASGDNLGDVLNPDSGAGVEWPKYGITYTPKAGDVRGLPPAWRTRFRTLRRAIEASYGPTLPPGKKSDGGIAFWIVWLDLLASAFAKGYLTPEFATFLLARQNAYAHTITGWGLAQRTLLPGLKDNAYIVDPRATAAPPTWVFGQQFGDPCPPMLISSFVLPLVSGWANSVHPYYEQGQGALASVVSAATNPTPAPPTASAPPPASAAPAPPASPSSASVTGGAPGDRRPMASLRQALAAKDNLRRKLRGAPWLLGIGVSKGAAGYVIKVNVAGPGVLGKLPRDVDGVPVRAQLVAPAFAQTGGADQPAQSRAGALVAAGILVLGVGLLAALAPRRFDV